MMFLTTTAAEIRKCSDKELSEMLAANEKDYERSRKFGRVIDVVSAHRLEKMKEVLALEQLATWRSKNGFDRDDSWMYGALPSTPQEFAASLWTEVNELKAAISIPARTRPWQKTREFVDGLEGKLPRDELAAIKRYVERRSREAAQLTGTPVDTVRHCSPRSQTPELPSYVCVSSEVHMEEEYDAGKMDPELTELEPPSAGTGFEMPGQQCPPNGEAGETNADGGLPVGVGTSMEGNVFSPTEITANTISRQQGRKPNGEKQGSEENKQFDPGGIGEDSPP